jgi:hypothetical protein
MASEAGEGCLAEAQKAKAGYGQASHARIQHHVTQRESCRTRPLN